MVKRTRKGPDPELVARMAALGATAPPAEDKPTTTPRTRKARPVTPAATSETASATRKPAARTMPAEQPKIGKYSARIELTTTPEQNRLLEEARLRDRIGKTARIRALIAVYEQDERLRRRVDRLAREWR